MIALILAAAVRIATAPCSGLPSAEAWLVCADVAVSARLEGAPPDLAVALAWSESRFRRDLTSRHGAAGPLQVVPRWACPGGRAEGCDLVRAGARVLRAQLDRHGDAARAVCHYAAGNDCNARAARYGRFVAARARDLSRGRAPWSPRTQSGIAFAAPSE